MFPQVHSEFSIYFVILLWIHYVLGWFTLKPIIVFANSLWINYIFRRYTLNSLRIFYLLRECTLNSPSFSRINVEFPLLFGNSLKIHYLFRRFTVNSLCFSLIHFEFTIYFTLNPVSLNLIHLFELTINSLSFSQIHFEFTIYFANSLLIYLVSNSIIWLFLASFDPILTSDDFLWPDLILNKIGKKEFCSDEKMSSYSQMRPSKWFKN